MDSPSSLAPSCHQWMDVIPCYSHGFERSFTAHVAEALRRRTALREGLQGVGIDPAPGRKLAR